MAEGFTRSQAAGHPRSGEAPVSQVREAAASVGRSVWRFLTEPPERRRARRGEFEPAEPAAFDQAVVEAQPPDDVPDVVQPLPEDELLPPEERGFVVGPEFDDPFYQKAYQFGFVDESGNILDPEGFDMLYAGWFDFQNLDFDEVQFIRSEFFSIYDISWRDFDDWREYISEYVAA